MTMDSHLGGALARAASTLRRTLPKLELTMHAADEWGSDPAALAACHADIGRADIVIATMLFLEDHIRAVLPALAARRDHCDAMICMLSAGEVVRLTRIGRFEMSTEATGAIAWLKRMRGKSGIGRRFRGNQDPAQAGVGEEVVGGGVADLDRGRGVLAGAGEGVAFEGGVDAVAAGDPDDGVEAGREAGPVEVRDGEHHGGAAGEEAIPEAEVIFAAFQLVAKEQGADDEGEQRGADQRQGRNRWDGIYRDGRGFDGRDFFRKR